MRQAGTRLGPAGWLILWKSGCMAHVAPTAALNPRPWARKPGPGANMSVVSLWTAPPPPLKWAGRCEGAAGPLHAARTPSLVSSRSHWPRSPGSWSWWGRQGRPPAPFLPPVGAAVGEPGG